MVCFRLSEVQRHLGVWERWREKNTRLIQRGPLLPPVPLTQDQPPTNRLSGAMSDEPEIIDI